MTDERDWYAMNDMQCTDTYAGWRCVLGQGHSGQHRANAAKPESDALSILQDLIAGLRAYAQHARLFGGDVMSTPRVLARLDRAEARLREVQGE